MRWIGALTECTDTTAVATVIFPADHFAMANGAPLETALVECVAQTVAAALGQRAQASGQAAKPGNGMLVAVSNFKIHTRPPPGKTLRIEVRELKRLGLMLMISGEISDDGRLIATGELTLYA